jgi:hypothetical protein
MFADNSKRELREKKDRKESEGEKRIVRELNVWAYLNFYIISATVQSRLPIPQIKKRAKQEARSSRKKQF